jgi:hypothetical protein
MTTLIIHPDDRSTDFLRPIYKHIPNKTVITGPVTQTGLHALIRAHDQIIMLGHGSPNGLFSISSGWGRLYLIGADEVEVLRGKELVAIWCHANQFMERYQLNGLYSGMFVSEVIEAKTCGLGNVDQNLVTESNDKFANVLGDGLIKYPNDKPAVWSMVLDQYSRLAEQNQIAEYNVCRWYYKDAMVEG